MQFFQAHWRVWAMALVSGLIPALMVLQAQLPTWTWIAPVLTVLTALGNGYLTPPKAQAKILALRANVDSLTTALSKRAA